MDTSIKLDISEGQINNAIAVAISEAFSPEKRDALLRDVLRTILTLKQDYYSKETVFSVSVQKALTEMVKVELDKQVELMRPEVEALVAEKFPGIKTSVVEQLTQGLNRLAVDNLQVSVRFDR